MAWIPPDEEIQGAVRRWLESHDDPKCAVCGESWSDSVSRENVELRDVPGLESTFGLLQWGNPDPPMGREPAERRTERRMERRIKTLGQRLRAFYLSSARVVTITCHSCGNMIFVDAYKVGVLEPSEA